MQVVGRGRWWASLGTALVATVLLGGCGGPDAGGLDRWQQAWDEAQATVPDRGEVVAGSGQTAWCEDVLGDLRAVAPDLREVPDDVLRDPVDAWLAHAERMFFECFDGEDAESVDAAFARLRTLAAEVDVALDAAG